MIGRAVARAVLWGVVNADVESRSAGLPAEMYSVDDDYRPLLDANLLSAAAVTSAFMPLLMASRGRVVNTGCVSGLVHIPVNAAYVASMSALVAWSESLRLNAVVVLRNFGTAVLKLASMHPERIYEAFSGIHRKAHRVYLLRPQ